MNRTWRKLEKKNCEQLVIEELMAVEGYVILHEDVPEGHYSWFWEARICNRARNVDRKPLCGYAATRNKAKKIVELLLQNTDVSLMDSEEEHNVQNSA